MKGAPLATGSADWVLYAVYTVASVAGLTIIKRYLPQLEQAWRQGAPFQKELLFTGIGAATYIASFVVWLAILSRIELSVAYPIAIGLTLIFATLSAAALLGEPVNATRLAGIVIVFVGIVLITRS